MEYQISRYHACVSTLSDQAFETLKQRVLQGELPPGQLISERQMARELGMSKTPVRAALARLQSEGLVTISPQRGVVVNAMDVAQIADCFELRRVLEPYVVRRLAGRLTPAQVDQLHRHIAQLTDAVACGDAATSTDLDLELHLSFARMLGNAEIARVMSQLRDKMRLSIATVLRQAPDRLHQGHKEHEKIVQAIIVGNGREAALRIHRHLKRGKRSLYPSNL